MEDPIESCDVICSEGRYPSLSYDPDILMQRLEAPRVGTLRYVHIMERVRQQGNNNDIRCPGSHRACSILPEATKEYQSHPGYKPGGDVCLDVPNIS